MTYRRILKSIGLMLAVSGVALVAFLMFFGRSDFRCAGLNRSLFLIGIRQLTALALAWGGLAAMGAFALTGQRSKDLLWAGLLGSACAVFHFASLGWMEGIGYSLSTLLIIGCTQTGLLAGIRRGRPATDAPVGALTCWGRQMAAGLIGVVLTMLWIESISCVLVLQPYDRLLRFLTGPVGWYFLWGVLPSLVSALLFLRRDEPRHT